MKTVERYPKCPWCLERIEKRLRPGKNTCPYCEKPFRVSREDIIHTKSYYNAEPIGGQRVGVRHLAYGDDYYKWHTYCGFKDIEGGDLVGDEYENWTIDTEKATCKECLKVVLEREKKKTTKAKKRLNELKDPAQVRPSRKAEHITEKPQDTGTSNDVSNPSSKIQESK